MARKRGHVMGARPGFCARLSDSAISELRKKKKEVAGACDVTLGTIDRWISASAIPDHFRSQIILTLGVGENQVSESHRGIKLAYKKKGTTEESREESREPYFTDKSYNILPLILAIAQTQCKTVTVDDMGFLLSMEKQLPNPLLPRLISGLLYNRHQSE